MNRTCLIELSFRNEEDEEDRGVTFRLPISTILNLIVENNVWAKSQFAPDVKAAGVASILKLAEDFFEI